MGRATPRWLFASAVLVLSAGTSLAEELTADEKKWLRQCVEALKSPSDREMAGAEDAIARLGKDALPALVPHLSLLDPADDFDWAALGRALAAIGATDSANALDAARAKWPKPAQERLATLVAELRAGKVGSRKPAGAPGVTAPPAGAPVADDPNVDVRVRALLAEYEGKDRIGTDDPAVRKLIALGRAAVPSLLRYLTEHADDHGMQIHAAQMALEAVVTEADIPAVAKALTDGALEAASCLKKLRTPAARDALLDVVKRGFMDHAVLEGLEPHGSDDLVRRALVEWLGKQGPSMSYEVAAVARFAAERKIAEAVPALLPLLKLSGSATMRVAAALAALGEKEGIGALVDLFVHDAANPVEAHDLHEAGTELNRIVGQAWYVGSWGPDHEPKSNFAEAGAKFREWWVANRDKLKFDAATRVWRVK